MRYSLSSLLVLLAFTTSVVVGQEPKPPVEAAKLPRVLIIGDSISIGYTKPLQALLKGKADVQHHAGNAADTANGVKQLKTWLGTEKWDLIHVNFGLHDIKLATGTQQVSIADYEKNLRVIVKELQATGATIVWCSTTPVPDAKLNPGRKNEDVIAYNAVARKIMEENKIPIDDLYEFALPKLKEIQLPSNVHFSAKGSESLAGKVAEEILKNLKKK